MGGCFMESRRIISNRKIIILISILLLFNGCWYLYQQHSKWKNYDLSITQAAHTQENYLLAASNLNEIQRNAFLRHKKEQLERNMDKIVDQENFSMNQIAKLSGETKIITDIENQYQYLQTYQEKIEKISKRAKFMSTISIFQVEDSFSQKNIIKTVKDYRYVDHLQLKAGINQPIIDTVFDPIIRYMSIIFMFFMILVFLEERKIGLWEKVHTTINGRSPLAKKRLLLLLASSFIFQILMVAERLIISSILYGNPNIFRMVQSIPEFFKFIYPLSIIEYLILYCFVCGLCSFCIGVLAWLILSIIQSPIMGLFLLSVGTVVEWICYFFIPLQSNLSIFKYANFYFLINPTKELVEYCNINFFGIAVNRMTILIFSLIVFGIGFSYFIVILANKIKPIRIPNLLDRVWKKLVLFCSSKWRKLLSKRSEFFMELYKTFGVYKGYLILLSLLIYLLSSYDHYNLIYAKEDIILNTFYQENSGPITKNNQEQFQLLKEKADEIEEKYNKAEKAYEAGNLTDSDINVARYEYGEQLDWVIATSKLKEQKKQMDQLKEDKNITPWWNNTKGIDIMLNKDTQRNRINRVQLSVFIMILLVSFSYAQETKSRVKDKLRTTVNGRIGLFKKKILSNIVICFLVSAMVWIFDYTYYGAIFSMGKLLAPIQTLETLAFIPFHCNVIAFLILLFLIRWFLLCCISFFVSFLSNYFTTIITIILSLILFMVPSIFSIIGIPFFKNSSIIESMTLMNSIIQRTYSITFILQLLALILFGITGITLCYWKWCKKGVGYETKN